MLNNTLLLPFYAYIYLYFLYGYFSAELNFWKMGKMCNRPNPLEER